MSFYGLLIFASVYLLAVATPGPGVAAIIARSLARGTQGAVAFIAGFWIGDLIWFSVAATGLGKAGQPEHEHEQRDGNRNPLHGGVSSRSVNA